MQKSYYNTHIRPLHEHIHHEQWKHITCQPILKNNKQLCWKNRLHIDSHIFKNKCRNPIAPYIKECMMLMAIAFATVFSMAWYKTGLCQGTYMWLIWDIQKSYTTQKFCITSIFYVSNTSYCISHLFYDLIFHHWNLWDIHCNCNRQHEACHTYSLCQEQRKVLWFIVPVLSKQRLALFSRIINFVM